jgi:hypothetical protein
MGINSSARHCTKATAGHRAPAGLVTDGIEGAGQALEVVQVRALHALLPASDLLGRPSSAYQIAKSIGPMNPAM